MLEALPIVKSLGHWIIGLSEKREWEEETNGVRVGRRRNKRETGTDAVTRNDHALLGSFRSFMSDITGLQFTSPFLDHQIKLGVSQPVEEK